MKLLLLTIMPVLAVMSATAQMPASLKGSWILDPEASAAFLKTSPKWKPEDQKFLPTIFKRMSQVAYTFADGQVIASRRGTDMSIPINRVTSEGKTHTLSGVIRDQPLTLTVTFVEEELINIRLSGTDDMDYYLWKRGTLDDANGASDAALATEAAAKAIEKKAEPAE